MLYRANSGVFACIIALAVLILAPAVSAQNQTAAPEPLFRYKIDMFIGYNKVLVESKMVFRDPVTANFSIDLPYDARRIHNSFDNFERPAILYSNQLALNLSNNKQVEYDYITEELTEGNAFIATLTAPLDIELLRVELSLPENSVLEKSLKQGTLQGSSVYPKPKSLGTDGQVIKVIWDFEDVKQGEEIALYARYRKPARYMIPAIIIISAIILIIAAGAYLAYRRKSQKKTVSKPAEQEDKKPEHHAAHNHLKEDEEQVINVLKLKEGRCEQGTLRVATGFSKSKLSGLLKELEERKIVHKEKRGKKNLVFLK